MAARPVALFALLFAALPTLASCRGALDLTVRFPEVSGLRQGDPVLWEGAPVGVVREIRYTPEGRFEVGVRIDEAYRAGVTDRVRFVVARAGAGERTALELVELEKGGTPLADGAVVDGSTRAEVLGEAVSGGVDRLLRGLAGAGDAAARELAEEVERFAGELGRAGREAREKLKGEVIPELRRRLEELRRQLRERGQADEADPIEQRLRQLERT